MPEAVSELALENPPVFDWDPWAMENLVNPYPMQEALREAGPVVWLPKYEMYAVGRYEECATVLTDHERFMSRAGTAIQDIRKPGDFRIPSRLVETDPPVHTGIRAVVNRILSPVLIKKMRASFEETAQELAAQLVAKGRFEAVEDLVETFVVAAFPAAVGVILERKAALTIAEMRFNQSGPPNELYHRAIAAAEPYLEWFDEACQRSSVVPGSIAEKLFEAEDAGDLDEGVASNIVRSFVGGGLDSTISGIGHTLHYLARFPDQFAKLKADPKLVHSAFDEGVRLDPPFQYIWRVTVDGTSMGGYRLEADRKVTTVMGAGNRDPRKWTDPDGFDVSRQSAGVHIGFGRGAHNCVGQMIARYEAGAIIGALIERIEQLTLVEEPVYRPVNQMRILEQLELSVKPS